ncbi:MAG TPA: hypothetical protein VF730_16625 [Terracidiphilus sp.]
MSYDLAVWHAKEPLSNEEAARIYAHICQSWPYFEGASPAVAAFYEELTSRWPEIDTIPEHHIGDFDYCPWACTLSHSGMAVVMTSVWSKATEVAKYVEPLARKHGLLLFDPQTGRGTLPIRLRPKRRGLLHRLLRRSR